MIPMYNTKTLSDIFEDDSSFITAYHAAPFGTTITDAKATLVYYALLCKYGNNPIANSSEDYFKLKVFNIIWQYGPRWQKELEIQTALLNLTESELTAGTKAIYNRSLNPSTVSDTAEEITTINEQNTTGFKRNKLESYNDLLALLRDNITDKFIDKFRYLFKDIVIPENVFIYENGEDDD